MAAHLSKSLLFLLVTSITRLQAQDSPDRSAPIIPAVLVFGDSIVDPGNNNNKLTLAKANFPPYGRDFEGGFASGRFSNGRVPPDFIASTLGVKKNVPAFLDPQLSDEDLLTGVSFASGAAGYDNLTAVLAAAYSMWDQLELYKQYMERVEAVAGPEKAAQIRSESVYVIFAGSNDILVTYFFTQVRALHYDVPSYIEYVINAASSFLKELHQLGARKIGVIGLPPLGCIPSGRTIGGGINRDCVDRYNQACIDYNNKLQVELDLLTNNNPGSRFIYLDIYNSLLELILHPAEHGFEIVNRGCCATGLIEASVLCNSLSPFTCPKSDTHKYLFWDGFHPTEKAFNIIITSLVNNYIGYLQ